MTYDYLETMKEDIRQWLYDNDWKDTYKDMAREDLEEKLNEDLWAEDSVTGNASGSYTFNSYEAEENIAHNWDLLQGALDMYGCNDVNLLDKGAEWCDVTIRCSLLNQAIHEVLDEDFIEEGEEDE